MNVKLLEGNLPQIPWEDKVENPNCTLPLWRYSKNPVVGRNPTPGVSRIFNSGVQFKDGQFIGVFRAERYNGIPYLNFGTSKDGLNWKIDSDPIKIVDEAGNPVNYNYMYDPRLIKVEDTYYMIFCTDNHGATIGVVETKDFVTYTKKEDPFLPFNRNGVLFPRKVNGKYLMMSRPSDSGHTPFGDAFISESPDFVYWGKHRHLFGKDGGWWNNLKVGGGCAPIETSVGWLVIFHGVTGTCNGFVYSIGGMILDIDEPTKVLYRCKDFLLTPEQPYETTGFVDNVCFPCCALTDAESGKMAIYYGAADTNIAVAFTTVDELVNYIVDNSKY